MSKLGRPDGLQSPEHSPDKTAFMDGKESSGPSRRWEAPQMIPKWLLHSGLIGDPLERHRVVLWNIFTASMTPHHATPFARLSHRSLPSFRY